MKEIPLTQGKVALVDDDVYAELMQYAWYAHKGKATWYARRDDRRRRIYMHRAIAHVNGMQQVDHIDGNGLNNTRANLRQCTSTENKRNRRTDIHHTSIYKGVHWAHDRRKWRAIISVDNCTRHIGAYATQEAAARAYDAAARQYFGEFARLNFPEPQVTP